MRELALSQWQGIRLESTEGWVVACVFCLGARDWLLAAGEFWGISAVTIVFGEQGAEWGSWSASVVYGELCCWQLAKYEHLSGHEICLESLKRYVTAGL